MNIGKAKEKNLGTQIISRKREGRLNHQRFLHASKEKHVSYVIFRAKVGLAAFITIFAGPKINSIQIILLVIYTLL